MVTTHNDNWTIQHIWNDILPKDYPLKPRDYIRASDIGKPYLDRWLSMKGAAVTNPFPPRVKRIFDTGLIFETDVVERMFKLLGILIDSQKTVVCEQPGLLKVIGHYDHRIGGQIDLDKIEEGLQNPLVSMWMRERVRDLAKNLKEIYPNGLRELIAEIKTVNSQAFWSHKNQDKETGFFKGYQHNKLQLFTYLLSEEQAEGRLFYISKDDLTLMETSIYRDDKDLHDEWMHDVEEMTRLYQLGIEPEREPDIVFNEDKGTWESNWRIKRSPYFTHITKYKTVADWEMSLRPRLEEVNTAPCKGDCGKTYKVITLEKNNGYCARCAKKGGEKNGRTMDKSK